MPIPFPNNVITALMELDPTMFLFAFVAILMDLATGFVIKGVIPHNVQSGIMREGLVHKSWEIAIMMCAALTDVAINTGMDIGLQLVSTATCGYILLMEVASVCENALEGNPELASAPIIKYVAQAKEEAKHSDARSRK